MARTLLLSIPLFLMLTVVNDARAQVRGWGVGVGVGYGYGPYWGPGFGPYWGVMPFNYNGFYGNGLSMYGPPVPTGKPIPGMFGGGDSQFFGLPPLYPGWMFQSCGPVSRPNRLPSDMLDANAIAELPAPMLERPARLEVEVRLPRADAKLFVDDVEVSGEGQVRTLETPPFSTAKSFTYELRAEWKDNGLTTTHSKKVIGHAGERVVVEFK